MKARLYQGTYDGQFVEANSNSSEIHITNSSCDSSRYIRISGSMFTVGVGGMRDDEEALFVLASALDGRSEVEVAIETYENGY